MGCGDKIREYFPYRCSYFSHDCAISAKDIASSSVLLESIRYSTIPTSPKEISSAIDIDSILAKPLLITAVSQEQFKSLILR